MSKQGTRFLIFVAIGVCSLVNGVYAQLSPGPLANAHSKLEGLNQCTQCHELGKEIPDVKCLACHTALQDRIRTGRGFHSSAEVTGKSCASCHSDHHGREFELIHWPSGRESMNHKLTGWPLAGAHRKLECRACHRADFIVDDGVRSSTTTNLQRTFLGLSARCDACHFAEHGEQVSRDCDQCHIADAWRPASQFTHDKSNFPLTGRHAEVACAKCHLATASATVPAEGRVMKKVNLDRTIQLTGLNYLNCTPCHTDAHRGRLGSRCVSCHSTENFQQIVRSEFDHEKTAFPLRGRHVSVACASCHKSGSMTAGIAHGRCVDCHKDVHRGQFANRADGGLCESCHTVEGFVPANFTIEAHALTRYALTGSHLAIPCLACHREITANGKGTAASYRQYDFTDMTCKGCHRDIHERSADKWVGEGNCESCHVTNSWRQISFNHDTTGFSLSGSHEKVACAKCHLADHSAGQVAFKLTGLKKECAACHRDPHAGQFARAELRETQTRCERCHAANRWQQLRFDHDHDSQFALDGAHERAACAKCHSKVTVGDESFVRYKPVPTQCIACHSTQPTTAQ